MHLYRLEKADIKRFLTDFYTDLPDDDGMAGTSNGHENGGGKAFKYSKQLVNQTYS